MLEKVNETNPSTDERSIASFELCYNLKVPKAYREFILSTNGGRPVPPAFPISGLPNNPLGVIQAFFGLNALIQTHDLGLVMHELSGGIRPNILPIACTDGDDFVCIDMRKPGPAIVFWDRRLFWGNNVWNEDELYPVAENFGAFLKSMRDFPM